MINPVYGNNDFGLLSPKYGYESYIAIKRHFLPTEGPISQYANAFSLDNLMIVPSINFNTNGSQIAEYNTNLLGTGYDQNFFSQQKMAYQPSFTVPILCSGDNVPADYVFQLWNLAYQSIYGDATEIVIRVSSISGNNIFVNAGDRFNLTLLNQNLNSGAIFNARIVDGRYLKSLTNNFNITGIDINGLKITASQNISASSDILYIVIYNNQLSSTITPDIPKNLPGYQYSKEFYLASSEEGIYYPSLINRININLSSSEPQFEIGCVSKRLDKKARILINKNQFPVNNIAYNVSRIEQYRIKISTNNQNLIFYGITPAAQDQATSSPPNPLFEYRSGINMGPDTSPLTNPYPVVIKNIDIRIENNLQPIYSSHSPRHSTNPNENFLNDLSRYDNNCPFAFSSQSRHVTGNLNVGILSGSWFETEFLPAISTNTVGSIEIDTGFINILFHKVVFNLAYPSSSINTDTNKNANFSFVTNLYEGMPEIGLSKTGGRL